MISLQLLTALQCVKYLKNYLQYFTRIVYLYDTYEDGLAWTAW